MNPKFRARTNAFRVTTQNRLVVIGDLHGCAQELEALIEKVDLGPDDLVVSCGDIVDRGPDALGCIDILRRVGALAVMGNHDDRLVRYWRKSAYEKSVYKIFDPDFQKTIDHFGGHDEAVQWLSELPHVIRFVGNHLTTVITHAGLVPGASNNDYRGLIRNRYVEQKDGCWTTHRPGPAPDYLPGPGAKHWSDVWSDVSLDTTTKIIYGHHSWDQPKVTKHKNGTIATIGVDTGACFGGFLTAAVVDCKTDGIEFVSVEGKNLC